MTRNIKNSTQSVSLIVHGQDDPKPTTVSRNYALKLRWLATLFTNIFSTTQFGIFKFKLPIEFEIFNQILVPPSADESTEDEGFNDVTLSVQIEESVKKFKEAVTRAEEEFGFTKNELLFMLPFSITPGDALYIDVSEHQARFIHNDAYPIEDGEQPFIWIK